MGAWYLHGMLGGSLYRASPPLDTILKGGGLFLTVAVERSLGSRLAAVVQLEAQLLERGVAIELTEPAAELLADLGFDEAMGARPLARIIQEHIKKPLAEELLFGKLAKGGLVRVTVREGKIALDILPPENPRLQSRKTPLLTAS